MKIQKWCAALVILIASQTVLAGNRFICEQTKNDTLHTIVLDWNPPIDNRHVDRGLVTHTTCISNSCSSNEMDLFSLSFGWIRESATVRTISLRGNAVNHGSNPPILSMRVERLSAEDLKITAFYHPASLLMECREF